MKTIYILSPNYPSYAAFVSKPRRKVKNNWKYVTNLSDIYGLSNQQIILLEGYCQHPQSKAVLEYANKAGWDVGEDY